MTMNETQIPVNGPLSCLDQERDATGVADELWYGNSPHLRQCFRIPIKLLHFNIENGRYHTKFQLLKKANPGVDIDPKKDQWKSEILRLLDGSWEDTKTGVNTKNDRAHFLALMNDIKDREQERPGMVLENGGVMSGNRRLAVLITLHKQHPENPKYQVFKSFIVPSEGGMTAADRWRLEISAQQGQGRLLKEYDSVERLLKIQEGVRLLDDSSSTTARDAAIEGVARDFGLDSKKIREELNTLKHITNYLEHIGHPEEWWLADGLTEVFTEWEPMERALHTNGMPFDRRANLKAGLYSLIKNEQVDYRFMREVRTAVGPARKRKGAKGVPTATEYIVDYGRNTQTRSQPTKDTKRQAERIADEFRTELQSKKEEERPETKAKRAVSNLQTVVEILEQCDGQSTPTFDDKQLGVELN